jgi:hypothetical protein
MYIRVVYIHARTHVRHQPTAPDEIYCVFRRIVTGDFTALLQSIAREGVRL